MKYYFLFCSFRPFLPLSLTHSFTLYFHSFAFVSFVLKGEVEVMKYLSLLHYLYQKYSHTLSYSVAAGDLTLTECYVYNPILIYYYLS